MELNLLFITPVFPSPTGNGLAMRAFNFFEAFAQRYEIHLLVLNFGWGSKSEGLRHSELSEHIAFVPAYPYKDPGVVLRRLLYRLSPGLYYRLLSVPSEWRFHPKSSIAGLPEAFSEKTFHMVHVFRLYMTPLAEPFISAPFFSGTCQLDIDDIESTTRHRLSKLHHLNGQTKKSRALAQEAAIYTALESRLLPRFERLFVSSDIDREKIHRKYGSSPVEVIPNAVEIQPSAPAERDSASFTFLFVGTLDYYPNQDAILYFCREILPHIRRLEKREFKVQVVGSGNMSVLSTETKHISELELEGYVADLSSTYSAADAVIVPLRAGGGTRIKALEAFSFQRPVISTSMGMEGIDAQDGTHFLLGDTAKGFAEQCVRLMKERKLRLKLTGNAFRLVSSTYSTEVFKNKLFANQQPG